MKLNSNISEYESFSSDGKSTTSEFSEPAYLCSRGYGSEADLLIGALNNQGIPTMVKHSGAGPYLVVLMGLSLQIVDIFVPPNLLEKAQSIMSEMQDNANDSHDSKTSCVSADNDNVDDSVQIRRIVWIRHIMAWLLLIYFTVSIIMGILSQFLF